MTVTRVATEAKPFITEALKILFVEGREILKERRERKEKDGEIVIASKVPPSEPTSGAVTTIDDARLEYIDEEISKVYEDDLKHLIVLYKTHKRSLRAVELQLAKHAGYEPIYLIHQRDDLEDHIGKVMKDLQETLSKVQGEELRIPELS